MHENLITRLRRRIGAVLAPSRCWAGSRLWAFAWGTFVIAWQVAAQRRPRLALVGHRGGAGRRTGGGLGRSPPAALAARQRAVLVQQCRCGGLLMTAPRSSRPVAADDANAARTGGAAQRGGRTWGTFLLGVLFLRSACSSRSGSPRGPPIRRLEIGPDAEQLAAQIDVLKEEKLLEPERAEVPEGAAQAAQG